jgi:hypothetical protein
MMSVTDECMSETSDVNYHTTGISCDERRWQNENLRMEVYTRLMLKLKAPEERSVKTTRAMIPARQRY